MNCIHSDSSKLFGFKIGFSSQRKLDVVARDHADTVAIGVKRGGSPVNHMVEVVKKADVRDASRLAFAARGGTGWNISLDKALAVGVEGNCVRGAAIRDGIDCFFTCQWFADSNLPHRVNAVGNS